MEKDSFKRIAAIFNGMMAIQDTHGIITTVVDDDITRYSFSEKKHTKKRAKHFLIYGLCELLLFAVFGKKGIHVSAFCI